ncbi:MAG: hypothetical protein M3285_02250 [Actinomycetota bacterium]|nr:hypothetical protein [Actinomycetota bacterium]
MKAVVIGFIALALVWAFGTAAAGEIDGIGALLLALIAVFGVISIKVIRASGGGSAVQPRRCSNCGGLISPSAPYCKHCKAPVT